MTAQGYLGAIGRTRTAIVHVTARRGALIAVEVYTGVDAAADPGLAEQLRDDALNVMQIDGDALLRIAAPVIYHDPAAGLLVLVLCEAHRHRELDERIRVLEQLRDDPAEVPAYAKDFGVVFGGAALRAYLERRGRRPGGAVVHDTDPVGLDGDPAPAAEPGAEPGIEDPPAFVAEAVIAEPMIEDQRATTSYLAFDDDEPAEPTVEAGLSAEPTAEVERAMAERRPTSAYAAFTADLAMAEFDDVDPDLEDEAAYAAAVAHDAAASDDERAFHAAAADEPVDEAAINGEAIDAAALDAGGEAAPDDDAGKRAAEAGAHADPAATVVTELPLDGDGDDAGPDATLREPGWYVAPDGVHLVIATGEPLAQALAGPLDLRLVLHRTASAPVIALVLGAPDALDAAAPGRFAVAVLDVAAERDRGVLRALARSFAVTVELVSGGQRIRRCRLTAPLADNAGYLVRAADDHRQSIAAQGEPDFARARAAVLGDGFDLLGANHPERSELRADQLAQIATARQLRRALAIARQFTHPAREDYLVCTRGFPLSRWQRLRRDAIARAVAWGLWMGPDLAQIAVSEGFARSRRDLITRLARGFEALRHDPRAFDIDPDATADNAAAIAEQARTLGIELRVRTPNRIGAIASDAGTVTSGSIVAPLPLPQRAPPWRSTEELLAVLDDTAAERGSRGQRLAAALALCERGDARAAGPVIAAALAMSRGDAVRLLARAVQLGPAAHPALIAGLASSKAYLRHGCALALALGRSDDATQAVIELLMSEPTELWQEIARAIGEIGTAALVWLVRNVGQHGATVDERIAWAMAHVAIRGGEPALKTMAVADSIVSPVATKALELLATVAGDRGVEGEGPDARGERDPSVNHVFSRQFFEALARRGSDDAEAEAGARDAAVES